MSSLGPCGVRQRSKAEEQGCSPHTEAAVATASPRYRLAPREGSEARGFEGKESSVGSNHSVVRVPKASAFPFSAPGTETRLRGEGWRSRDLLRPRTQRLCSHNRRPHPNRLSASASGAGAGRPRGQRLPPCQPRRVCARRNERLASLAYSPISGQQGTPHAWFPLASDPRGRRCGAWRHRGRGLRKEWIRHWRNEPIRRGQRRVEAG